MLTPEVFLPLVGKCYYFEEDVWDDLVKICARSPEVPSGWGPRELFDYAKSRGSIEVRGPEGKKVLRFRGRVPSMQLSRIVAKCLLDTPTMVSESTLMSLVRKRWALETGTPLASERGRVAPVVTLLRTWVHHGVLNLISENDKNFFEIRIRDVVLRTAMAPSSEDPNEQIAEFRMLLYQERASHLEILQRVIYWPDPTTVRFLVDLIGDRELKLSSQERLSLPIELGALGLLKQFAEVIRNDPTVGGLSVEMRADFEGEIIRIWKEDPYERHFTESRVYGKGERPRTYFEIDHLIR